MSMIFRTSAPLEEKQLVGAVLVGVFTTPLGAVHFYHATDGYTLPTGAVLVIEGLWKWADMKAKIPAAQWAKVADAMWEVPGEDGKVVKVRGKMADRPINSPAIAVDLPPHRWAGENT
jgi:hypothetical protein